MNQDDKTFLSQKQKQKHKCSEDPKSRLATSKKTKLHKTVLRSGAERNVPPPGKGAWVFTTTFESISFGNENSANGYYCQGYCDIKKDGVPCYFMQQIQEIRAFYASSCKHLWYLDLCMTDCTPTQQTLNHLVLSKLV